MLKASPGVLKRSTLELTIVEPVLVLPGATLNPKPSDVSAFGAQGSGGDRILGSSGLSLMVQVPNYHILTQDWYYNYYYPKPKYPIFRYLDPLGMCEVEFALAFGAAQCALCPPKTF